MKKILSTLTILLAICSAARAQNCARPYHDEINLMYGIPSISGFAVGIVDVFVGAGSEMLGSFTTEYFHYNESARFAYGGAGTYECIITTTESKEGDSKRAAQNFFTLMPSGKVVWFNTKHIGMYSKAAAGLQVLVDNSLSEDKASALFAFQVNPVCIEAGGDSLRGFAEFGWGMQGLFHGGIRFNF